MHILVHFIQMDLRVTPRSAIHISCFERHEVCIVVYFIGRGEEGHCPLPTSLLVSTCDIKVASRHQRCLAAVFEEPTRANIVWADVERMLVHYGAEIQERAGSAVAVELGQYVAVFHRPHPQKEAKRYAIRNLRDFLTTAGLTPSSEEDS